MVINHDGSCLEIPGMFVPIDLNESRTQVNLFYFLPDEFEAKLAEVVSDFPSRTNLEFVDQECESIYSGNL